MFVHVFAEEKLVRQVFDHSVDAVLWEAPQVGEHPQSFPARHLVDSGVKLRAIAQPVLDL